MCGKRKSKIGLPGLDQYDRLIKWLTQEEKLQRFLIKEKQNAGEGARLREKKWRERERKKEAACIHLERPVGGGSDSGTIYR